MRALLPAILFCVLAPGCVVIKVGVQNPIPGMNKIVVVPFVNLSQEPAEVVDGRRFALAYYAELQKTPGFQVIPVGVAEVAIQRNQLNMSKKDDVLALARVLNADAVVIGAVTDYSPYYPQRIGLQIDWYSPRDWPTTNGGTNSFCPPGDSIPLQGSLDLHRTVIRAQGAEPETDAGAGEFFPEEEQNQSPSASENLPNGSAGPRVPPPELDEPSIPGQEASNHRQPVQVPGLLPGPEAAKSGEPIKERASGQPRPETQTPPVPPDQDGVPAQPADSLGGGGRMMPAPLFDPRKPIMSYTRIFDGADSEVINRLRDYIELRGDRRGGGWEAYLHRSEDFIRFTSHIMIVEMLSLHGGATKSQIVFKWRKYQ